MEWSGSLPGSSRRAFVALGVVAVLCAASSLKAQPADPLKFNTDNPVLIIYSLPPDKAADFEAAWAAIRAGFAKMADKPDMKAFGETLNKVYKVDLGASATPAPAVVYVQQIDAPSKTMTYNPVKIIYEMLHNNGQPGGVLTRPEADDLYAKFGLAGKTTSINPWPLVKVGG
jgi:hypothetical protein